jgi:hypothetical protein
MFFYPQISQMAADFYRSEITVFPLNLRNLRNPRIDFPSP